MGKASCGTDCMESVDLRTNDVNFKTISLLVIGKHYCSRV
jgi:hypothetical protein